MLLESASLFIGVVESDALGTFGPDIVDSFDFNPSTCAGYGVMFRAVKGAEEWMRGLEIGANL